MDITEQVIADLDKRLRAKQNVEHVLAKTRQLQIARALGRDRRSMEGMGRVRMEVDSTVYHYWGRRLGYKCWRDEAFLREMERDNPEMRVNCGGTRVQFGYKPSAASRSSKFHKSYGTA